MIDNNTLYPVILCGGSGTRLWPLSRETYPKQFHCFVGEHTLFEATVLRAVSLPNVSSITIVCNENHRFMAAQQAKQALSSIGSVIKVQTVLEPVARNTAAAIGAVAHLLPADGVMVVMPSDHHMTSTIAFNNAVADALHVVEQGYLCTFGIVPTAPETGYGYIESGELIGTSKAHIVKRFIEKPNLTKALALLATGTHTWNSGMFVMRAAHFLRELAHHAPLIHTATQQAVQHAIVDADFMRLSQLHFVQSPNTSVDFAVFERTSKAAVVDYHGDWSDLGSWAAVADLAALHPNASHPPQVSIASNNNFIHASKSVALVGVDDLVVVDTPDALLITRKSASQQVKDALAQLKLTIPTLATHHRKVHRPWGWYDSIDAGEFNTNFQVKRIHVNSGASLSLQSHAHRAEHWVVVQGTATIGIGKDLASVIEQDYTHGQNVYIPLGHIHRLTNRTANSVEIIEVQCGKYLGEDDIVRYADIYGRAMDKLTK